MRRGRLRRLWARLHEKSGKQHAMACHHNRETYPHAYIGDSAGAPVLRLTGDDPEEVIEKDGGKGDARA